MVHVHVTRVLQDAQPQMKGCDDDPDTVSSRYARSSVLKSRVVVPTDQRQTANRQRISHSDMMLCSYVARPAFTRKNDLRRCVSSAYASHRTGRSPRIVFRVRTRTPRDQCGMQCGHKRQGCWCIKRRRRTGAVCRREHTGRSRRVLRWAGAASCAVTTVSPEPRQRTRAYTRLQRGHRRSIRPDDELAATPCSSEHHACSSA